MKTHYHVVEFIDGCLNDYDSGPFDAINDAREWIENIVADTPDLYEPSGESRYVRVNSPYILKIESCNEQECEGEWS
jgi:hypothetical protein